MSVWSNSISKLKGVGPRRATQLEQLGIRTMSDLIQFYPRRYEDRSQLKKIAEVESGQLVSVSGLVYNIQELKPRRGLTITKVFLKDDTGVIEIVWFNQSYKKNLLKAGLPVIAFGRVEKNGFKMQLQHAEIEIVDSPNSFVGKIVPVYSLAEGMNQNLIRNLVDQVLFSLDEIEEIIPEQLCKEQKLLNRQQALMQIHHPDSQMLLQQARKRLVFEELFFLQYGILKFKKQSDLLEKGIKHGLDGKISKTILEQIPFNLTEDQTKALAEIKADMEDIRPMHRLLQGDVGSGKTVVAALALAKTVENGYQGALMAPTEILAEQHYHSLSSLLAAQGIRIGILTGSKTKKQKENLLASLIAGNIDILIGTHALIQDNVEFQALGLVVTDEQHRFGVDQRAALEKKGTGPDVLVMTATPIPRTMALTVYGDLDVSVIRQMPPGRKPIQTFLRSSDAREKVYKYILSEVKKGRQAYIVCPLIEESDKLSAQSAIELYEELSQGYLKEASCGLVHGRLSSSEKDQVMQKFYINQIQVLVATTVIEVGVNVPNATVMVIEGADRFGLAQLHQLRGRIGRGELLSRCILLSQNKNQDTLERLNLLTASNDGFYLAEQDLLIRGPGQFFGKRQHGLPDLKIANIVSDVDILLQARSCALKALQRKEWYDGLNNSFTTYFGHQFQSILNT